MIKLIDYFKRSKFYSTKDLSYFYAYESLLSKYKNKNIKFVEIGVSTGGSLFMWKKFFGKNSKIIGIDLNSDCKKFKKYGFNIEIGDQSSTKFWKKFYKKYGKIDVILDDGGHRNDQQIMTTYMAIKNINDGGLIIIEDTSTSYLKKFGNPSKYSFINYSKKIIDDLYEKFVSSKKRKFSLADYVYSVKFYGSLVCFEINKKLVKKYGSINNGKEQLKIKDFRNEDKKSNSLFSKIKFYINPKDSSSIQKVKKFFY